MSVERQVGLGFSWLLKGRSSSKIQSLCVRSSFGNGGGSGSASDSSSIAENKKMSEGLLLGPERDASGSVVGFQLIPHSGTAFFVFLNLKLPFSIFFVFLCSV